MNKKLSLCKITIVILMLALCFTSISLAAPAQKDYIRKYYRGDVTLDDALNTGDATLLLKMCASATIQFESELQEILADANNDGVINTADASYVLRVCAEMVEPLYYEVMVEENFTLTFDAGEGTIPDLPSEFNGQSSITLRQGTNVINYLVGDSSVKATREGYTFVGWEIEGQLIDKTYAIYNIEKDITAVAVYEEITSLNLNVSFYDAFNEQPLDFTSQLTIEAESQAVDITSVQLPEGYKLDPDSYPNGYTTWVDIENGAPIPPTIKVNVYPFKNRQNQEFKVIYNLKAFLKIQKNLAGNYILGNDIDMSSISNFVPFGWDWANVDNPETYFTGIFDGDNHVITSLRIQFIIEIDEQNQTYSQYKNVGLFSINQGTIRNVSIYTRQFTGDTNYGVFGDINVGIVAGYNFSVIENCHTYGNVGAYDYMDQQLGAGGGICGTNNDTGVISKCSFEGGAEGFFHIGGIVGKNFGAVEECYFIGGINWDVTADFAYEYQIYSIGGIGGASAGSAKNCYAYFTYNSCGWVAVGGIFGRTIGGSIQDCWVFGADKILYVEDNYGGIFVGYISSQQPLVTSGLINYHEYSGLPSEYDKSVWDMNGACLSQYPDLINNRRKSSVFDSIAD